MEEENRSLADRVLYGAQVVVLLYSGATAIQGLYKMGSDAGNVISQQISKRRQKSKNDPTPLKVVSN